jgi:superfamily II DNA or RNA helicase
MINRIAPFFFKRILYKIETADLIEQGFLSPIQYYADNVDTSELKVNSTGRDFTDESMEKFWNDKRLRRIAEAVEYADGHHKKSLIFCSSLRQAGNALKLVTDMGFNAAMVSGPQRKWW